MHAHEQGIAEKFLNGDLGVFINGEFVQGQGEPLALINPVNGEELGRLSSASQAQLDQAVEAAQTAFEDSGWATDVPLRVQVLTKLAELVDANRSTIAYLDAIEAGKLMSDSIEGDVDDVIENLLYFASLVQHDDGRYLQDASGWGWVKKIPVGVVGAVLPWNFPIAMFGWKIGPALASGSTLIAKPSEESTLSALFLAQLAKEAGVPDGVLGILTGDGPSVGQGLGRHMGVDMISFTGSEEVGRMFLKYSAESNLKKVSLELGGRAVYVIDSEHTSDLGAVVEDIVGSAFGTGGQNCTATSRIVFVGPQDQYEEFSRLLGEAASAVSVGDPLDENIGLGPVVNEEARDRINAWVQESIDAGARIVGERAQTPEEGFFVPATVLEGVPEGTKLATAEIFGPVTQLIRTESRQHAVDLVNKEPYGLASTVWCEDVNVAKWWSDAYRVGTLAFNGYSEGTTATPFGGLRQSGFWGRDNGPDALAGYQETMTIWHMARD